MPNLQNGLNTFNEWKPLANQGDADAQYRLDETYSNDMGTLKDLSKASYWIRGACKNLDASADTIKFAEDTWKEDELWKY